MAEEDDTEKEHEATPKRLEDARARGEIVRSADLLTAAAYGGFVLAALAGGGAGLQAFGQAGAILLGQPDQLSRLMLSGGATPFAGMMGAVLWAVAPFFGFPALAVLAVIGAQRAFVFAPEKLAPRWSRISPLAAVGQKFGPDGLFEFAKSAVKLCVVSVVLGAFLVARQDDILGALYLDPALALVDLLQLSVGFLCLVLLVAVVLGGADYLWQRASFLRRQRMSRQEVIDELRQSDGDPHTKAQRRQRGYDIATNRMMLDVPRADVIIVNPTHFAVALKWSRADRTAPVCLAKGTDEVAARIRTAAAGAGVPIHSDPPTARAIHATVSVGQEIRPEHYRAAAAAIRFAEAMRRKAKARR